MFSWSSAQMWKDLRRSLWEGFLSLFSSFYRSFGEWILVALMLKNFREPHFTWPSVGTPGIRFGGTREEFTISPSERPKKGGDGNRTREPVYTCNSEFSVLLLIKIGKVCARLDGHKNILRCLKPHGTNSENWPWTTGFFIAHVRISIFYVAENMSDPQYPEK